MIQSLNKVSVEKSKKKASWKLKGFKHLTCYRGITIAIVFIFNLLQIICIDILWLCMTKKKKRHSILSLPLFIYPNSIFYFSCKCTSHHWDQSYLLPNSESFLCTRFKKKNAHIHPFLLLPFQILVFRKYH